LYTGACTGACERLQSATLPTLFRANKFRSLAPRADFIGSHAPLVSFHTARIFLDVSLRRDTLCAHNRLRVFGCKRVFVLNNDANENLMNAIVCSSITSRFPSKLIDILNLIFERTIYTASHFVCITYVLNISILLIKLLVVRSNIL